jgi:ADP-heptose:LPS heptosyltransferase
VEGESRQLRQGLAPLAPVFLPLRRFPPVGFALPALHRSISMRPEVLPRSIRALGWLLSRLLSRRPRYTAQLCIFKCDRFGDFLLAAASIRALVSGVPPSSVVLVCFRAGAEIAKIEFPEIQLLVLPEPEATGRLGVLIAILRHWAILRNLAAEVTVCLRHQRNLRDDLALSFIRSAVQHATDSLAPPFEAPPPGAIYCGELLRNQAVVSAALQRTISVASLLPKLSSITADPRDFCVIAPLGGHGENCIRSLPEKWIGAGIKLLRAKGIRRFLLCGMPAQRPALEEIYAHIPAAADDTELFCPPNFMLFAGTLAQAHIVFAADTAAAHLAGALDIPLVAILGGGHYGEFAPWSRSMRQIWLSHHLPCFGCGWNCPFPEPRCITEICGTELERAFEQVLRADPLSR